jgi:nitrogen regulatory protein P-II 1
VKTVIAIVRTESLDDIVSSLEDMGIRGMTITEIKGIGEEVSLYKPYTIHNRVEIIVPDKKVDAVIGIIVRHGKTGTAGDGLIGVYPMEYIVKIRTGEKKTD